MKEAPPELIASTPSKEDPSSSSVSSSPDYFDEDRVLSAALDRQHVAGDRCFFPDLKESGKDADEYKNDPLEIMEEDQLLFTRWGTVSITMRVWATVLGCAAFFDFASTVLVEYYRKNFQRELLAFEPARNCTIWTSIFRICPKKVADVSVSAENGFFGWVETSSWLIGMTFSMLWFVDAFVQARRTRDETLRECDRKRLAAASDKSLRKIQEPETEEEDCKGASRSYYVALAFHLFLLPVGFYVFAWHLARVAIGFSNIFSEEAIRLDLLDQQQDGYYTAAEQTFTRRSDMSLLVAQAQYFAAVLMRYTGKTLQSTKKSLLKKTAKRVGKFLVQHPLQFRQKAVAALTVARWIKYLAPLCATGNKLIGNLIDLFKKYHQRLAARRAAWIRMRDWKKLTLNQKREVAAIRLQAYWRATRTRRVVKVLLKLHQEKETRAAKRFQQIARGMLKRARLRLLKKRLELEQLQAAAKKENEAKKLSVEERRRMYQLQDELHTEASELLNRRLLLRPNTTLAFAWKFLFVCCVLLEFGQKAYQPTNKPMEMDQIFREKFIPTPISEWTECYPSTEDRWVDSILVWSHWKEHPESKAPWYCQELFVTAQSTYISALRFILSEALAIVGTICFLDVFVTFFEGELHPENGVLIPKPIVKRWILPGLMLQLLINPRMAQTYRFLVVLVQRILDNDPVRVWRWTAALFFPLTKILFLFLTKYVWIPLVRNQNNNHTTESVDAIMTNGASKGTTHLAEPGTPSRRRSSLVIDSSAIQNFQLHIE